MRIHNPLTLIAIILQVKDNEYIIWCIIIDIFKIKSIPFIHFFETIISFSNCVIIYLSYNKSSVSLACLLTRLDCGGPLQTQRLCVAAGVAR